ncbi:hypothetical protein OG21DRAFT_1492296 [Imleria badia]|nr:hypothetical protein OG21DRAFT_1492296 [Imleria badia]
MPCVSGSSRGSRPHPFQSQNPDELDFASPLALPLQRTASFYGQPFSMNVPNHSLSAVPSDYNEGNLQINEISLSEDERVAEGFLH